MKEGDVPGLNPGIRETVSWLRSLGYDTCDSGDGKTHDYSCDRPYAYVVMRCHNPEHLVAEASKLRADVEQRLGRELEELGPDGNQIHVEAVFLPVINKAFIELTNADDAALGFTEVLK